MTTPPQVVAFRTVTVAVTLLILLVVGLGLAGLGPAGGLTGLVHDGVSTGQSSYMTGTGS